MVSHLAALICDEHLRRELACHGLATVTARHTCHHRVDELFNIYDQIRTQPRIGRTAADNTRPPGVSAPPTGSRDTVGLS